MPDDDRHTRDRVRTLDPLHDRIRDLAAQAREEGRDPRKLPLPTAEDTAARALRQITDTLGRPDLGGAAERTRALARRLREQGPESLDLCAGYRASGMRALLDQAVSVVLSSQDPATLLAMDPGDLAELVGEHFVLGALRRYGLDRLAPFTGEGVADTAGALDFLELADLTLTTTILRSLVRSLLR